MEEKEKIMEKACEKSRGIIDCMTYGEGGNFLTLNLNGLPVFAWIVSEMFKSSKMDELTLVTDSNYIKKLAVDLFGDKIIVTDDSSYSLKKRTFMVSGRASFLKADTIDRIISGFENGVCVSSVKADRYKAPLLFDDGMFNVSEEKRVNAFVYITGNDGPRHLFELDSVEGLVINSVIDFELALVLKRKELNASILVCSFAISSSS